MVFFLWILKLLILLSQHFHFGLRFSCLLACASAAHKLHHTLTTFSVKLSQKSAVPDQALDYRELNWLNLGPGYTLAIPVENLYDLRAVLIFISLFSKMISFSSSPLILQLRQWLARAQDIS